jgi:hypothetical protein
LKAVHHILVSSAEISCAELSCAFNSGFDTVSLHRPTTIGIAPAIKLSANRNVENVVPLSSGAS